MDDLYFGYGSNLGTEDWNGYCRDLGCDPTCLTPVGAAWLPDHELAFTYMSSGRRGGVLDVRQALGSVASGFLFRASATAWRILDRKEGAKLAQPVYRRVQRVAYLANGQAVSVGTYEVAAQRRCPYVTPAADYLALCVEARRSLGLEVAGLEAAALGTQGCVVDALFVYGTLLPGEPRNHLLVEAGLVEVGQAEVMGMLVDCGSFPALLAGSSTRVRGLLVRAPDIARLLTLLDRIEGFVGHGRDENLFARGPIATQTADGTHTLAWTYLGQDPSLPVISGGCWRSYAAAQRRTV